MYQSIRECAVTPLYMSTNELKVYDKYFLPKCYFILCKATYMGIIYNQNIKIMFNKIDKTKQNVYYIKHKR